jgi:hypothetical protein
MFGKLTIQTANKRQIKTITGKFILRSKSSSALDPERIASSAYLAKPFIRKLFVILSAA